MNCTLIDIKHLSTAYGNCQFETYIDMSASGASQVTSATSLDACLSACVQDTTCFAVEYSEEYKCWMHKADITASLMGNPGVTTYRRESCASKTSAYHQNNYAHFYCSGSTPTTVATTAANRYSMFFFSFFCFFFNEYPVLVTEKNIWHVLQYYCQNYDFMNSDH